MGRGRVLGKVGSCLRRNDGGGAAWAIGVRRDWCGGSRRSTPHLTSPLEGGRDELGRGRELGRVGSCLRRNDGGGAGVTEGQEWRSGRGNGA